ncbi:MAG: YkgJ family cysteine cluster protein [Desulfosarcina sp.]|nr:YkgJ family cysteine cluster protein [Desulfosarcina sp.]
MKLTEKVSDYMQFRQSVDGFLNRHFNDVCTLTCYRSRTSACCSKDGIITFFADTVVNALHATPAQLDHLETVLGRVNGGNRCVYLGSDGCIWTVRPVVCAMFLCDRAMNAVFSDEPGVNLGYRSTLMHLNLSPGLLRVKKLAGLK